MLLDTNHIECSSAAESDGRVSFCNGTEVGGMGWERTWCKSFASWSSSPICSHHQAHQPTRVSCAATLALAYLPEVSPDQVLHLLLYPALFAVCDGSGLGSERSAELSATPVRQPTRPRSYPTTSGSELTQAVVDVEEDEFAPVAPRRRWQSRLAGRGRYVHRAARDCRAVE